MAAEVGQKAPDFELLNSDKQPTKLSDSKGKNVVLAFFPGAFTGVCTSEMCNFRDRADSFNSLNADIIGVSVDSIFAQKAFSDANNLQFPLLSDHQREVGKAYGVSLANFGGIEGYTASERAVFVIDKDGVIKFKWVGENPGVEPDYDEVQRQVDALN
ncbi:MAG: peroxiredoxin [Chloroflexi bacterium]|nr:peroxiredoxin [Chloroflexota bacterium]